MASSESHLLPVGGSPTEPPVAPPQSHLAAVSAGQEVGPSLISIKTSPRPTARKATRSSPLTPFDVPRQLEWLATQISSEQPDLLLMVVRKSEDGRMEVARDLDRRHQSAVKLLNEAARVCRSILPRTGRFCQAPGCGKPLPADARQGRQYCGRNCKAIARRRRQRDAAA